TQVIGSWRAVYFPGVLVKTSAAEDDLTVPAFQENIADRLVGVENRTITVFVVFVQFYIGVGVAFGCTDQIKRSICRSFPAGFIIIDVSQQLAILIFEVRILLVSVPLRTGSKQQGFGLNGLAGNLGRLTEPLTVILPVHGQISFRIFHQLDDVFHTFVIGSARDIVPVEAGGQFFLDQHCRSILFQDGPVVESSEKLCLGFVLDFQCVAEFGTLVDVVFKNKGSPDRLVVVRPAIVVVGIWVPVTEVNVVGRIHVPGKVYLVGESQPWCVIVVQRHGHLG